MKRRKQNLEGYKRQGKRFIPPLKQLPMVRERSYVNDMLPELIWLGLIHDRCGYKLGAKTLEATVETTKSWPVRDEPVNYALQSAYGSLSEQQKEALLAIWAERGLLREIQFALAPLTLLYEGCALAFVGPPPDAVPRDVLIERLSECVGKHMDKYETPGIVLNGTLLLTRLFAGTIKIASHIELPNLNAVIDDPQSDEARRAASFMRANALGEFGMLSITPAWAKYFWDHGAELTPCELPEYAHDW